MTRLYSASLAASAVAAAALLTGCSHHDDAVQAPPGAFVQTVPTHGPVHPPNPWKVSAAGGGAPAGGPAKPPPSGKVTP